MEAVLMSVRPKWCKLIAKGLKSVEVRKNRPIAGKLYLPFKVYIYCTKQKGEPESGKVIGEFVCDRVDAHKYVNCYLNEDRRVENEEALLEASCLEADELHRYLNGNVAYGWHISNLVIYDKPKELSDFKLWQGMGLSVTSAPQSWIYVYQLENEVSA